MASARWPASGSTWGPGGTAWPGPVIDYLVRIWCLGDSTTVAAEAVVLAAWRSGFYPLFGGGIRMVGSQSYGGTPNTLGVNAAHEGHNGWTIRLLIDSAIIGGTEIYDPDVAILIAGINDIGAGADATLVLARWSEALDELWARRPHDNMQIVLCPPFRPFGQAAMEAVIATATAGAPAMIALKSFAANVTWFAGAYESAGVDGMYAAGNVHPNDLGYSRIAPVLAAGCATAVSRARPP